jgi:renalase
MAGAACARALADAGVAARLFDKGRSVGGRMVQRRVDGHVFDHGAQYLSAAEPGFAAEAMRWQKDGIVAEWTGVTSARGDPVMVGVPAMNAPVKALLDGLPVRLGFRVSALAHGPAGWSVRGEEGAVEGPFKAVVLAIPAPQAATLLEAAGGQRATGMILRLGSVRMAPCWSALVAFPAPIPVAGPALRSSGDLVWAARNGSKPARGNGDAWTLHAEPHWSAARLERSPGEIAPELLAALAAAVGQPLPAPAYLSAHRWRYALVERPLGEPCLWDEALRLGLCGDWCLGPRVEAAWMSGRALAAALANGGVGL